MDATPDGLVVGSPEWQRGREAALQLATIAWRVDAGLVRPETADLYRERVARGEARGADIKWIELDGDPEVVSAWIDQAKRNKREVELSLAAQSIRASHGATGAEARRIVRNARPRRTGRRAATSRRRSGTTARSPDDPHPLARRALSTRELAAHDRAERPSSYRLSVSGLDAWLHELAEQGLVVSLEGQWRLTPAGRNYFLEFALTWGPQEVAA